MDQRLLRLRALLPWDRFAAHQLGAMHATGEGAPQSLSKALRWYRLGARRGDPESQYDLGFMILLGEGVAASPTEAVAWLSGAALSGHRPAAQLLAELYRDGAHGIAPNAEESRRWEELGEALQGRPAS